MKLASVWRRFLFAAAALGGLASLACNDRPLPTQITAAKSVRLTLTFSRNTATVATTVAIEVSYLRTSGELVGVLDRELAATVGTQQLALSVDLATCLSDPTRVGDRDACPILVSVTIRDAAATSVDSVNVGPFEARPGSTSAPFAVATSFADTMTVKMGDTIRVAAAANGVTVGFTSADTSIAIVSSSGLVTGRTVGLTTITTTSERGVAATRVQVSPRPEAALSANTQITCALSVRGAAYCWGSNVSGGLGNGTTTSSNVPVAVAGAHVFSQLSVGSQSICAVATTLEIYCWGTGGQGQLGTGATTSSAIPVRVAGTQRYKSASVGSNFACGLTVDGAAFCWGNNTRGTLGTGDTLSTLVPAPVSGGLRFRWLGVGGVSACGLTADGKAYCWGSNGFQTLGVSTVPVRALAPVAVEGNINFANLSTGFGNTCGVATNGVSYCWGDNFWGSLGDGTTQSSNGVTPIPIVGGVSFAGLSPSPSALLEAGTCGLSISGAAYCWGINSRGQLGTNTTLPNTCNLGTSIGTVPCTGTPTQVATTAKFTAIVMGGFHSCGIATTHEILCWGDNSGGELGDGTTTNHSAPAVVTGGLRAP